MVEMEQVFTSKFDRAPLASGRTMKYENEDGFVPPARRDGSSEGTQP